MTLIDHDLGTPAPRGASRDAVLPDVAVTIDGMQVVVPEGTSVMRAAALAGVDVPMISALKRNARTMAGAALASTIAYTLVLIAVRRG